LFDQDKFALFDKQIEANRELRLFEIKSNELGAQWRADQRSLYKVIKE
jgi:hypothetical protein